MLLLSYLMTALASFLSSSAYTSMLAFLFLAVIIAVIIYIMTRNVVLSAALCIALGAVPVTVRLTAPTAMEGAFQKMMRTLSLFDRMSSFTGGILDLEAIVYYLSVCVLFVFLTVQAMEKRRWS